MWVWIGVQSDPTLACRLTHWRRKDFRYCRGLFLDADRRRVGTRLCEANAKHVRCLGWSDRRARFGRRSTLVTYSRSIGSDPMPPEAKPREVLTIGSNYDERTGE